MKRRDLRAELVAAEHEARNKKRKAEGKPPLIEDSPAPPADEEANKRRKLLQDALALDADSDEEGGDEAKEGSNEEKGKAKASAESEEEERCVRRSGRFCLCVRFSCFFFVLFSEEEESEDEEEDDTAELLRELEKIKRERAEEKARLNSEQTASQAASREAEIATANPLLNLAAALGQQTPGLSTTAPGTFQVKKRWDDGLLFSSMFWFRS